MEKGKDLEDLADECPNHLMSVSVPLYEGKPDKRSTLYHCVYVCPGYDHDCRKYKQLVMKGLVREKEYHFFKK